MTDYSLKMPLPQNMQGVIDYRIQSALRKNGWQLPCKVKKVNSDNTVLVEFQVYNAPMGTLPDTTIALVMWDYVRIPIQVGDLGYTTTADVYLGGVTGKGGGRADFTDAGNLSSTLLFQPVSNTSWKLLPSDSSNKVTIWGPSGVTLRDGLNTTNLDISKSGCLIRATETILDISPTGISGVTGGGVNFAAGGDVAMTAVGVATIDSTGNTSVTSAAAVEVTAGGAITLAGGAVVTVDGANVVIAGATIEIFGELIINGMAFMGHIHGAVMSGPNNSGPVVTPS